MLNFCDCNDFFIFSNDRNSVQCFCYWGRRRLDTSRDWFACRGRFVSTGTTWRWWRRQVLLIVTCSRGGRWRWRRGSSGGFGSLSLCCHLGGHLAHHVTAATAAAATAAKATPRRSAVGSRRCTGQRGRGWRLVANGLPFLQLCGRDLVGKATTRSGRRWWRWRRRATRSTSRRLSCRRCRRWRWASRCGLVREGLKVGVGGSLRGRHSWRGRRRGRSVGDERQRGRGRHVRLAVFSLWRCRLCGRRRGRGLAG